VKVVLFCGGKGSRWTRHGDEVPKALAPIGDRPLIHHVMQVYLAAGFDDFILCLGHKGETIRRYFESAPAPQPCRVQLVDTGEETQTGGRLRAVAPLLTGSRFLASYGDGVADLDVAELLDFHLRHGRLATLTAVRPRSQFGILELAADSSVASFVEKPLLQNWVNGGFFIFEPGILDRLDEGPLEDGLLSGLAREGELMAFRLERFWACLDTYKDQILLDELWQQGRAPWRRLYEGRESWAAGVI
jgi:glucose-1-phosphate cytidylyltransferase